VFGAPRHLALAGLEDDPRAHIWPVPFSVEPCWRCGGGKSPCWSRAIPSGLAAGRALRGIWRRMNGVPSPPFHLRLGGGAAGLGLEDTACLGLHAAPFERLVPVMGHGARAICLLRDGAAVGPWRRG
jgi:precorrin-6Y C5,15-methyltransferase (decarboxylating)